MKDPGRRPTPFPRRGHNHAKCVRHALVAAAELCARQGERLTPLRRRVLELVWSSHQPIGAYAILDRLKTDGRSAAPPTVYRGLEFLLEQGLVHRIASLNAFIGCADPGHAHSVQILICTQCGAAAELDDGRVNKALGRSAAENGFSVEGRIVELSGVCGSCRGGGDRARAGHRPHVA
ncbi:MAG: transcriptional repressor [Proteobacteria bacterium]|nr:transcriptional repressor [Pseudomonadota bacterium]